jgi:hypothetical protein
MLDRYSDNPDISKKGIASLKHETIHCIRWNSSTNEWGNEAKTLGKEKFKGMPVSRGKAIWFILPDDFFNYTPELQEAFEEVKQKFPKK